MLEWKRPSGGGSRSVVGTWRSPGPVRPVIVEATLGVAVAGEGVIASEGYVSVADEVGTDADADEAGPAGEIVVAVGAPIGLAASVLASPGPHPASRTLTTPAAKNARAHFRPAATLPIPSISTIMPRCAMVRRCHHARPHRGQLARFSDSARLATICDVVEYSVGQGQPSGIRPLAR